MLSRNEIEQFVDLGYVKVEQAFPGELGDRCADELWEVIDADRHDRSTWTQPVVRIDAMTSAAFVAASTAPRLHEAFDQLVGEGCWVPRQGLGTFPLRFPTAAEPDDAGWHVEGSFTGPGGEYRVNLRSDGRALLMLFLFSAVGPDDAPTRIRQGSHLDVAPLLRDAGDEGIEWMPLCRDAVRVSARRAVAYATGVPGDVYLCHPFLVHAAQPHRGRVPRFMAQPPLVPNGRLDLEATPASPVVRAIQRAVSGNAGGRG